MQKSSVKKLGGAAKQDGLLTVIDFKVLTLVFRASWQWFGQPHDLQQTWKQSGWDQRCFDWNKGKTIKDC